MCASFHVMFKVVFDHILTPIFCAVFCFLSLLLDLFALILISYVVLVLQKVSGPPTSFLLLDLHVHPGNGVRSETGAICHHQWVFSSYSVVFSSWRTRYIRSMYDGRSAAIFIRGDRE